MSLATRSKPFRYATAKPVKTGVYKASALAGPPVYSSGVSANAEHVAVGYGASKGSVLLLPVDASAYKPAASPFTISAHGCELGDLAFAPHLSASGGSTLATAAMDGTVKLWSVPSSPLDANLSTPLAKFEGMDAVHSLAWHPSAEGVLAAGGKAGLNVFDITAGKESFAFKTEGFGKDVTSLHWNRTGALLAAVTKNAALAVIDPRSAAANVLGSSAPSTLIKKLQHGVFIGGEGSVPEFLLLFGVAASQRPVMMWVDPRNPTAAVKTHDFDFSQGYALPVYEPDTTTLFYTIRGSEMLALLDVESEKNAPSVWPSHQFSANSAIKGFALLPKRAVATNSAEVNRVYTLGAESVDTFSVTVPRKTAGFHAELFPDTNDTKAALSAAEWAAGADKAPLKTSMVAIHENGGAGAAAASAASAAGLSSATSRLSVSSPTASSSAASPAASSAASSSSSPANRAASGSVVGRGASGSVVGRPASTSVAYVPSDMRAKIDSTLKKSPYTHCMGKEPASNFQSYFDTQQGPSIALAENVRTNGSFFACPWKASGGSALAVFRIAPDALGRCPPTQPCVRGHKFPASSFDFSPFQATQLASGCVDGTIFLWRIPERGLVKDLNDPESTLSSQGKVTLVRFHPYVADVLLSATGGFEGQFIEIWDVSKPGNQSTPAFSIKVSEEDPIVDFCVHPRSHLLATSSRDGKVRVWSFGSRKMLQEWAVPEGVKDTRVVWVGEQRLLSVGFGSQGSRSMSLFDTSSTPPKLLQTFELERINYLPLPRFDFDTKLLFLANSGGTFIPLFQLSETAPYIEQLNVFQTASDCTGFTLLPKLSVDVHKVEITRALKLTKDAILPISYTVPRKRTEFFQDDLFPDTRQAGPELSAAEFVAGKYDQERGKEWTLVSMRPQGMEKLSEAPEEEATVRQQKYASKLAADAAPKPVGALGHTSEAEVRDHFLSLQANVGAGNRWDARVDSSRVDVDESEWD